jgi:hypothetical protein
VFDLTNAVFKVFKRIFITMIVAHWSACLFYAIGIAELEGLPTTWLTLVGIEDAPLMVKYVYALYLALTTIVTVGYGDIHPVTTYERCCILIIMLVGAFLYAFNINEIGNIVSRYNILAN